MSNLHAHAKSEFDILIKKHPDDDLVIAPFIEPILVLVDAFGESGQSGGSAPFTARRISKVLEKLFAFKPLSPLTGEDSEWNDVSHLGDDPVFQNNRCSHIFKGMNGVAYDIDGYVFWSWSERSLDYDEEGFPGTRQYKSYFTSVMSRRLVEFPYSVLERIEVEVDSYEVNKKTGEREPGSGWWQTDYPEWLVEENKAKRTRHSLPCLKHRRKTRECR